MRLARLSAIVLLLATAPALAADPNPVDPPLYSAHVDSVTVNLWIPPGVKELRGLVVKPADASVSAKETIWSTPMRSWGFGEVGMMLDNVNKGGGRETHLAKTLVPVLTDLAAKTGHPELPNLPIVSLGMSKGGGWAAAMCRLNADRAIGYVSVCGWMGGDVSKADASYLKIPGLFAIGSVPDGFHMLESIDREYVPAMKLGDVDWTCALQWGAGHAWLKPTSAYCITYLDQVIKLRLPDGASALQGVPKLNDIAWDTGWAGDRSTWDSACPVISSLKEFKGDRSNLVWQPNCYLAYVWRAFMTQKPEIVFNDLTPAAPLEVTAKNRQYLVETGTVLPISTRPVADAKTVRFYDGDILLGEAPAASPSLDYKVPAGNHAVIALAEKNDGALRSSNVLWVVGGDKRFIAPSNRAGGE